VLVEGTPLSELDLARLKAKQSHAVVVARASLGWPRPTLDWRGGLQATGRALARELETWQAALPSLLRGDFVFTLMLWVAVFCVAAAVVADVAIPMRVRYGSGLVAVAYLFIGIELARLSRPVPGRTLLLGAADLGVAMALGALSVGYVPYARVLLFFAAARMAARIRDPRILAAGLLLLLPFEAANQAGALAILLDAFLVLMTMWLVVHLTSTADRAQEAIQRQGTLAALTSGLARVREEEALFALLAAEAPALVPGCAWAFWSKDAGLDEFRAVRWAGLREGELPGFNFTPTLGADPSQPVQIQGPLPGTSFGDSTVIQPTCGDGSLHGLITVSGRAVAFDAQTRGLIRAVGEEMGATLQRLQALDDQRQRTEAMEQANRLAGLAAPHAGDQRAALAAIRPALADLLRSESLHLEWLDGDRVQLVVSEDDPLQPHAPGWLPLAGTRTAEVLLEGRALREPLTGRRPEDLFGVPAGLRQVAVAPLRCAGADGTLQLARRLPRAYAASELMLLQLLAERLGLLFAAGLPSASLAQVPTQEVAS
jgi:hypothetical protein